MGSHTLILKGDRAVATQDWLGRNFHCLVCSSAHGEPVDRQGLKRDFRPRLELREGEVERKLGRGDYRGVAVDKNDAIFLCI
jgi:hypothetical protein